MTARARLADLPRRWRSLPPLGRLGVVLLTALLAVAATAPLLAPHDPAAQVGPAFARPGRVNLLGTNDIGQDILSELIFGARVSLAVGLTAALAATTAGTLVGVTAGYLGGPADALLMRLVDVALALPFLPLMIVVGVFLGPGLLTQVLVIAGVIWAGTARELRAQVLSTRQRDWVRALEAMGAGRAYVLHHHLVPVLLPLIVPQFVRAATVAILAEAALSFLGLGDPTAKSWGTMLFFANARSAFLTDAWLWWIVPPGAAITLTVLSFVFIGFTLEERARPRLHTLAPAWRRPPGGRPPAAGALLAWRDLTVTYGQAPAVDAVDLDVEAGGVLGVVGGSGSGKSTLLATAIGLLKAPARITSGHVLWDGEDLLDVPPARLRRLRGSDIALVPQAAMNALDPVRTVRTQIVEAIRLHRRVSRARARSRADALLERVALPPERGGAYPHELSGGMRQRAVIAMALANKPRLLLVDEPTTGLDPETTAGLLGLLGDLSATTTVVLISHDLAVVARLASQVVVMRHGRVVERGVATDLLTTPAHPYTHRLVAAARPKRRSPRRVPSGPPLLHLDGVCRRYPTAVAADDVDLAVHEGEVVGLVGPSGAGKSTLGRLAVGLERPDAGRVLFQGRDLGRLGRAGLRAAQRHLHLVFQDPYQSLPDHRRVATIVGEPLRLHGCGGIQGCVPEALAAVGLDPDLYAGRFPHELSGGERQRVALARAVVLRPHLVVLDEPTSMLDAELRQDLLDCLEALQARFGVSYLCITHDLLFARAFCDRLVALRGGRVQASGPPDEVVASFGPAWDTVLAGAGGPVRPAAATGGAVARRVTGGARRPATDLAPLEPPDP